MALTRIKSSSIAPGAVTAAALSTEVSANISAGGGSAGSVTGYTYANALPLSGNTIGDQAYVSETNRLYLWTGTGWYNIALVNTGITISQGAAASYTLTTDGPPAVISLIASDPEEVPIAWSYSVTSGSLINGGGATATVTQNDNEFTITPTTNGAYTGSFEITFTASDGVNIATSVSVFYVLTTNLTLTPNGGTSSIYSEINIGSISDYQILTVDTPVTVQAHLWGASGGTGNYGSSSYYSGAGGYVTADINLSPGTNYYLYVGKGGLQETNSAGGAGGWPNGGFGTLGDAPGAGGGGMTMISTEPFSTSMSPSSIILIAGGGGGATGYVGNAGAGGGLEGQNAAGGITGGTQTAGGTYNGGYLIGGNATGSLTSGGDDGGGGGGGYYGGGGGTSDAKPGAGGSGYINSSLTINGTFAPVTGSAYTHPTYGYFGAPVSTSSQSDGNDGRIIIFEIV